LTRYREASEQYHKEFFGVVTQAFKNFLMAITTLAVIDSVANPVSRKTIKRKLAETFPQLILSNEANRLLYQLGINIKILGAEEANRHLLLSQPYPDLPIPDNIVEEIISYTK